MTAPRKNAVSIPVVELADRLTSFRASLLARNLRRIAKVRGVSPEALFKPMLDVISLATLYRYIGSDDWLHSNCGSTVGVLACLRHWPMIAVDRLSDSAEPVLKLDAIQVRQWLYSGNQKPPRIELVQGHVYVDDTKVLKPLDLKLKNYAEGAREAVGWGWEFPMLHTADTMLPDILQGKQEDALIDTSIANARQAYADIRSDNFCSQYNSTIDMHVGIIETGLNEVLTCTGHCRNVRSDTVSEFLDSLWNDAIKPRENFQLHIISKDLSSELQEYVEQCGGAYAIDRRFLSKVSRDGMIRAFFERAGDPQRDRDLDRELALLYGLLKCVRQDLSRPQLHELFKRADPNAESEKNRIRGQHLTSMRGWNPPIADMRRLEYKPHPPPGARFD